MVRGILSFLLGIMVLAGCRENDLPFEITAEDDGRTLIAIGVIDETTPIIVEQALSTYPQAETLILQFVPGSINEEQNKIASRLIRAHGLKTIVPADGLVASGGTAMFVSGTERVLEKGACVGVHTWWVGGGQKAGADLEPDDVEHLEYLEYYDDMGITPEFYWFGIRAAGEEDFHWMDRQEMNLFGLESTNQAHERSLKNKPIFCDRRHDVVYEDILDERKEDNFDSRQAAIDRLEEIRAKRAEREGVSQTEQAP